MSGNFGTRQPNTAPLCSQSWPQVPSANCAMSVGQPPMPYITLYNNSSSLPPSRRLSIRHVTPNWVRDSKQQVQYSAGCGTCQLASTCTVHKHSSVSDRIDSSAQRIIYTILQKGSDCSSVLFGAASDIKWHLEKARALLNRLQES